MTVGLTTHPETAIDFHRYALYSTGDFTDDMYFSDSSSILWLGANENSQKLFNFAREVWKLSNGIVLIERQAEFEEQFYFAADIKSIGANNFYLNNLELLKKFNCSFLEDASGLIELCDNNRLPKIFENSENITRLKLTLSPREAQLLKLLSDGFSCKNIASKLGIKVKTVYFYLDNIKQKTSLFNRDALIDFYRKI